MKYQDSTNLKRLAAATALAMAITFPLGATANDKPASTFSIFLRTQAELVNGSGDALEANDNEGLRIVDGWANGGPNSGNWGALFFRGGHKISDDLEAIGTFALSLDVNGKKDADRDVFAGLRSKRFGQIRVGRLETPYKTSTVGWDPANATFLQARGNQGRSGGAFGHQSYLDRAIRYDKSFNGISLNAFVGIDDSSDPGTGETRGNHVFSAALTVPVGPVELLFAQIEASEYRGGADDRDGTKLGVRYSEGPWTVAGHWETRGEGAEDGDFIFLTTSYKKGKWTPFFNYGQFTDDRAGRNNDGQYFAVGARYTFTRIAAIHFGYRRSDRDIQGAEDFIGLGVRVAVDTGNLLKTL